MLGWQAKDDVHAVRSSPPAPFAAAVGLAAAVVIPHWSRNVLESLQWKRAPYAQHFVDVVENRSGIITVTEDGTVFGHGMYDGRFSTDLKNVPRFGFWQRPLTTGLAGRTGAVRDPLARQGRNARGTVQRAHSFPGTARSAIIHAVPELVLGMPAKRLRRLPKDLKPG
jgi:hypothetical protein